MINLEPVGFVESSRIKTVDDNWDVESVRIVLSPEYSSSALSGLEEFSHVEIIFFMDQVALDKIESSARHPRGNKLWPKVGIFAQRGKNRPNRIGTTICKVLEVRDNILHLEGLDAIDGTPVLDIKPWVQEFGPRGEHRQPEWITSLMRDYWVMEND